MSRCRACDAKMNMSAFWYKDDEGNLHVNDLCNQCCFISDNADFLDTKTHQFQDDVDVLLKIEKLASKRRAGLDF